MLVRIFYELEGIPSWDINEVPQCQITYIQKSYQLRESDRNIEISTDYSKWVIWFP